ncbi:cytochrome c oxidase subunit 3 family protein [Piscirickettsia litoralis]
MTVKTAVAHHDDHHHDEDTKDIFGFWIYIMSDCILFAIIFATYAVLHNNTFGGPGAGELASIPFILTETILLLVSSFTYGLAMLARNKGDAGQVLMWLVVTFILGFSFVAMELYEFAHLIHEGNSWQRSGFFICIFYTRWNSWFACNYGVNLDDCNDCSSLSKWH